MGDDKIIQPVFTWKLRSFIRWWMPPLAWMLVIFFASTDLGSAEHTSRFLMPFLRWLQPNLSSASMATIQFLLRKLAHLTEYAVLSALLLRAFRGGAQDVPFRKILLVFGCAALYAVTDEFHQSFSPGRTASPRDVLIDCGGAMAGLAICWAGVPAKRSQASVSRRVRKD